VSHGKGSSSDDSDPGVVSRPAEVTAPEMHACAERLLNSHALANAPSQREFLRFVIAETMAGRGRDLKEYVIGVAVLGRPDSFDPRTDASVRVAARRLRQKIDEYYAGEGQADDVRLALERGGYAPRFERRSIDAGSAKGDGATGPSAAAGAGLTATGSEGVVRSRRRWAWAMPGVTVLVALAALGAWAWRRADAPRPTQVIAVLPFANATADPSNEYVCFGIVEDLTTALTSLQGIDVIARTSASQFSGKGLDLVDVGHRLGADLLIEGSIRRDESRLLVTAQLIETHKGTHIWAGEFEGNVAAGVTAQQQVARAILETVRDRLGRRVVRAAQVRAVDPAALALYWKGRFTRAQRQPDGMERAVEYFTKALAIDPSYVEARAELGDALATLAFRQTAPSTDLLPRARAELQRAVAQDPKASVALAALAWIAFFHDHDWPSADRGFKEALAINASSASTHNLYALALAAHGKFDEALEHSHLAVRYDPVRYAARNDGGFVQWCARRYKDAETTATGVLDADPNYHVARVLRGLARVGLGVYPEAAADLEAGRRALGPASQVLARLVWVYTLQGDAGRAQACLTELETQHTRNEAADVHLAVAYAVLGRDAAALDRLERAETRHEVDVNFIAVDPAFDRLRTNPRFQAVAHRIGLDRRTP
jgi:TolB-like protein